MAEEMRFVTCENLRTSLCPFKNIRSNININVASSGQREVILLGELDAGEMQKICLECKEFSILPYYKEHKEG